MASLSELNIEKYVPIKLTSDNYYKWKAYFLRIIKHVKLLGFINGSIPKPTERMAVPDGSSPNETEEVENPVYQSWLRSDKLVQDWIKETLEKDALELVQDLETAEEMWRVLEKEFTNYFDPDFGIIEPTEEGKDLTPYLPLYKAAIEADWNSAKQIFNEKPDDWKKAVITGNSETALIVAAQSAQGINGNQFLKKLIELLQPEDLAHSDIFGYTALHVAAKVGNIQAAQLLVNKNPGLPHVYDNSGSLPLHKAAVLGRKEMVQYLLHPVVTKLENVPQLFEDISGIKLVEALIINGIYDIALTVVQQNPKLAFQSKSLQLIGKTRSAFLSGTQLNLCQRLIYTYVPLELNQQSGGDNNNPTQSWIIDIPLELNQQSGGDTNNATQSLISGRQKLHARFWKVLEIVAPQIKNIRDKKVMHHQARQLVNHLCKDLARLNNSKSLSVLTESSQSAACDGIHEVVEEILDWYPSAIVFGNELGQTIFHLAIQYRRENVFNLIYQVRKEWRDLISVKPDSEKNMFLHAAANLGDDQKLSLRADAASAALQMQRELKWFKEVEKHTLLCAKESINTNGKTPAMLFTETHQDLVKEGEKSMKDTAKSCTIVATLIVTIVFAAAITVPGGNNNESGRPIFSKQKSFVLFAMSNALALFSSTSSLLMFLSILTSRYGERDFLYALPKRLIIGLVTLFLSIISMMMAFGAILFLVFGDTKAWMLIPVVAFSCMPVILFASFQFPLLLEMIKSTYGPGLFGKQSNRLLY